MGLIVKRFLSFTLTHINVLILKENFYVEIIPM